MFVRSFFPIEMAKLSLATHTFDAQVVQILKGDESSLELITEQNQKPSKLLQRTYSEEFLDAEEYNSTKYMNDLNRHMEVILEEGIDT